MRRVCVPPGNHTILKFIKLIAIRALAASSEGHFDAYFSIACKAQHSQTFNQRPVIEQDLVLARRRMACIQQHQRAQAREHVLRKAQVVHQ